MPQKRIFGPSYLVILSIQIQNCEREIKIVTSVHFTLTNNITKSIKKLIFNIHQFKNQMVGDDATPTNTPSDLIIPNRHYEIWSVIYQTSTPVTYVVGKNTTSILTQVLTPLPLPSLPQIYPKLPLYKSHIHESN